MCWVPVGLIFSGSPALPKRPATAAAIMALMCTVMCPTVAFPAAFCGSRPGLPLEEEACLLMNSRKRRGLGILIMD